MKNFTKYSALTLMATGICASLTGCGAISAQMHHGSLTTSSRMSQTIFLDPVPDQQKVIYVDVHDTSSKNVNLRPAIVIALRAKGWRVTRDLSQAHDKLQVNVLQVGRAKDPDSVWSSMNAGFNGALLGGLAGVTAGVATDSAGVGLGVGLGVGAVSWLANEMVHDIVFSMITDIQISMRVKGNVVQTTQANLSQGSQTQRTQHYRQTTHWVSYRTRIASVADKVNLKFNQAKPALVKHIASEIAGIF